MKPLTFHRTVVVMLILLSPILAHSQVKDIMSASKKSGGGRRDGGGRGSDVSFAIDVVYFSVQGLSQWQRYTLAKRDTIPSLVSFDASFQAALQPSAYYILNPRIR